jgi:4-hydroxybenzoate polyprenyltransferase/phosphoserine phosphatase
MMESLYLLANLEQLLRRLQIAMAPSQTTSLIVESEIEKISDAGDVRVPLCVDLDGTLIKTDLLLESLFALVKQNVWATFLILWWLLHGRSRLKRELAARVTPPFDMLPYRRDVLDFLQSERQSGRQILLVTAADQSLAEKFSAHLGLFDAVYGTEGSVNLKGQAKAGFLAGMLGKGNFDYCGDSYSDLPVWSVARSAYVVGSENLARRARRKAPVLQVFPSTSVSLVTWLRSIRLLHWSKNLLVLLPVLLAHSVRWAAWRDSLAGFFLFGGCASGLYILNDLLDLHSDRLHPTKSKRPFAAGEFSLKAGVIQSTLLTGCSLSAALFVNPQFAAMLLGYAILTIAYSWKLKKIPLLDVFVLSSFYTIRIWSGGLISGTPVSDWLMAFSLFFFLSLAMAKRHSELQRAGKLAEDGSSGRGYVMKDMELLAMLGIASSFAAVVILCLYARSHEVRALYGSSAQLLWLCPVVLYWLSRVWLLSGRGELDHDPVLFAVRDRTSWALALVSVAILILGGFHTR